MKDKDKSDNEIIAEFMDGFRLQLSGYRDMWHIKSINKTLDLNEMEYDTSWDWLMPVVEKISEYRLAYPEETAKVCNLKIVIQKQALYRSVIEFIKWFNQTVRDNG